MISFLGYVLYAVVLYAVWKVSAIKTLVDQALMLAPELSIGMFTLYFYPLVLAIVLLVFRKKDVSHGQLLSKQTNIAASVAVSLGLIGTFQGLTAMVSSIAASMGGEGDLSEKMGSMIGAISQALSAMSYAFLTSILGVAVSVLLILSLNFWSFRFKGQNKEASNNELLPKLVDEIRCVVQEIKDVNDLNKLSFVEINKLVKSEETTVRLAYALELLIENEEKTNENINIFKKEIETLLIDLCEKNGKKIEDLSSLLMNALGGIQDVSEKHLDTAIEQKFILSSFKEEMENERNKLKLALKELVK